MSRLKQAFEDHEPISGNWISIGHPAVTEVSAALNLDFVLIDTEHTSMGLETVEELVRGVEAQDGPTEAIVRAPWNDPVKIKRILDIGAPGLMVPMVDTAKQAEKLVDAVRYPPDGSRGVAGGRAATYGLDFEEYVESAESSISIIAQIESERGVNNAADIAAVDGIDALFVGPADLSISLGEFHDGCENGLTNAMEHVINVSHEADVPVGTLTVDRDDIEKRVEQGIDYLIFGKDTYYLSEGTELARSEFETALSQESEIPEQSD